jgi:hypothetical protein
LWPVEDSAGFEDLLAAIDQAQERLELERIEPPQGAVE